MPRLLHHPPGVHDDDAVGDVGDHAEVVCDEEDRRARAGPQVAEHLEDAGLDGDVQGGGGFVGDQQLGPQATAIAIITRWRMPPES